MHSTKKAARVAGLLYVLACIPAPFSLIYVPRTLIVPENATATANNILASESLFTKPQLAALAMVFLRLHAYGIGVAAIFWGLWLVPFGVLVYRSGFLPRILGVLLIINCFAYVIPSFTSLLLPQYRDVVSRITAPALLGEAAVVLWFLIRGAKDLPLADSAA